MVPASYLATVVAPQLSESEAPKTQAILRFAANLIKTYYEIQKGPEISNHIASLVKPISQVSFFTSVHKRRKRRHSQVFCIRACGGVHSSRPRTIRTDQQGTGSIPTTPRRDLFKTEGRQDEPEY